MLTEPTTSDAVRAEDERDEVHRLMDGFADEREQRVAMHVNKLARTARRLGREVAAHRVTIDDADRRLEALASTPDGEMPIPCALIPYKDARKILRDEFARGLGGHR